MGAMDALMGERLENLARAARAPSGRKLTREQRKEALEILDLHASVLLGEVMFEAVRAQKDPTLAETKPSLSYLGRFIGDLAHARPRSALLGDLGLVLINEAADRLACRRLRVPFELAIALLNTGKHEDDVFISPDGQEAGAETLALAHSSGETLYRITADCWLRLGGNMIHPREESFVAIPSIASGVLPEVRRNTLDIMLIKQQLRIAGDRLASLNGG